MRRATTDEAKAKVEQLVAALEAKSPHLRALEIVNLRNVESAEVATDAHPRHAAAMRAIRTIGAALNDEGWQRAAERLLFPPAPETREKRVLATRDWVLFHRRRSNSCDCCVAEKKEVLPARRYRFFEVTAGGDTTVEEIRQVLARGEDIERFADAVGVLEFEGGTAQLTSATSPTQIRQGWTLAQPAASIVYGAIASEGAALADPQELAEQRAGRAADLVRSVTPVRAGTPFDVLPLVPNGLSSQGSDGIVMLVTVPTQTQRHRVVSLRDQGMMTFVMQRIQRGELAAVIDENDQMLGGVLEVRFSAGTDTVVDDSMTPVERAWTARWGTDIRVARALVVLPAQDAIAQDLAERQGRAIAAALRGERTETTLRSSEDAFAGCEAITILEPSQRGA
jgi:hypothetical protein